MPEARNRKRGIPPSGEGKVHRKLFVQSNSRVLGKLHSIVGPNLASQALDRPRFLGEANRGPKALGLQQMDVVEDGSQAPEPSIGGGTYQATRVVMKSLSFRAEDGRPFG